MPVAEDVKCSWADEVELEGGALPPPTEVFENGFKIITEYKINDDGKKEKIVRTYKIEKRIVSKSIAARKTLAKFGESAKDKPGPNPQTTIVAEDVYMQFISSKEEDNKVEEESALDKLKGLGDKGAVKCRTCNGDHWTTKCPYKDTQYVGGKLPDEKKAAPNASSLQDPSKPGGSKYVPPNMRDGARKGGDNPNSQRRNEDMTAIRITNLSESTTDADIEDLVKPFGPINRIFLAKDKATDACKGFAYVHFKFRKDAADAINTLHGHGYDHLILSVDWSVKPQQ
ncbi:eukaryotic translation initiation factor 3 subunit G-like isoform X2 [Chrysoperla carnea]|uniref:eukaryotic translation initiation factor 3 subunit G-like isoform X2 n=1 Tax=Chrysoperla carnea TaxID=189513 RepID=UPI001D05E468|nr:eukaryotic translation initiation factor 3 subunit G-like isoform X2 [Chrysoperla carnea]